MLTFVGLGLYDGEDISLKGLSRIQSASHVFIEEYTSRLMGIKLCELEDLYKKTVKVLTREDLEQQPGNILEYARAEDVVLLTGGDPMVSTTHADLRIRAAEEGIQTGIVHGSSIMSAVCGLSGLQNYRFGKSCSVPYPAPGWFPTTPFETIHQNLANDLHTLVYLDIKRDCYMTVPEGIALIEEMSQKTGKEAPALYVGIARAGSPTPCVRAGTGETLLSYDFGLPLHILIVPAKLHPVESEYLKVFAGL